MDCIRKKVNEEIARGNIGPNKDCPYHPAHFKGQNCSFCYCPFFPCNDETLGESIKTKHGDVWSCSDCLFMHRDDVVEFTFSEIERLGIADAGDERFKDIFAEAKKRFWRKGKALMVVGATSDAGKSITVAALCRILHEKGYIVAPFKSQNMSLNSKVTVLGAEIAMIQTLQAKAAGLTNADYHMNPLLLKPKSDGVSQVIVHGKPYADYDVKSYYEDFVQNVGREIVKKDIEFLKNRYDYVIMEGAGSPAEINIYDKDIANMGAADAADADVILVVNMDAGGSFAYALGTIRLIPEKDRSRIKGLILNNVNGDIESIRSFKPELERITQVPVLGIVPHMDLVLPNEDSESLRGVRMKGDGKAVIGVIRFPRIANFTDLDPLLLDDVSIVFVEKPEDLDHVDAIVIPGTKNTMADYRWLIDSGIADKIKGLWKKVPIVGLCGGYQMMGKTLDDANGFENGEKIKLDGLGFFDNNTVFGDYDKRIMLNKGKMVVGDEGDVTGYELHMGQSDVREKPLFSMERFHGDPEKEGSVREGELTFGTYQHGIFDKPAFRKYFLSFVKHEGKSINVPDLRDYDDIIEENLSKLAESFSKNVDIDAIIEIMERK